MCADHEARLITYLASAYRGDAFADLSPGYLNALLLALFMERTVIMRTKGYLYGDGSDGFHSLLSHGARRESLLSCLKAGGASVGGTQDTSVTSLVLCHSGADQDDDSLRRLRDRIGSRIDFSQFDFLVAAQTPRLAKSISDEIVGSHVFEEVLFPAMGKAKPYGGLCLRCSS